MKKTIILFLLSAFTVLSYGQVDSTKKISKADTAIKKEKVYTLKLTETEIQSVYNLLTFSMAALPTSKAPANDVNDAVKTMQGFQAYLKKEYELQADKITTKPKK